MSRPNSSSNRPNHIPLPTSPFPNNNATRISPTGSPLPTPQPLPLASPTSPRSSFLPSFMRTRSRAATITNRVLGTGAGAGSPTSEAANPLASSTSRTVSGSGPRLDGGGVTRSVSTPPPISTPTPAFAPQLGPIDSGAPITLNATPATDVPVPNAPVSTDNRTYRIRLVPHLESTRSLAFEPVVRDVFPIIVRPGITPSIAAASVTTTSAPDRPLINGKLPALLLKIGRFTDKALPVPNTAVAPANAYGAGGTITNSGSTSGPGPTTAVNELGGATSTTSGDNNVPAAAAAGSSRVPSGSATTIGGAGDTTSNRVAFRSKVVSRGHAEIWCEPGGKFFIRDTASSSGTFLNHIRLSSPGVESRPQQLNDGDTLQLGVDFQGGAEEIFRCVKMRVEIGREWQRAANEFNTNALKQLKALGGGGLSSSPDTKPKAEFGSGKKTKANVTDCCICLFSVTVCQSLFIAPCSHVFHYKCIRPLLLKHHPGFSCPLCRTFANLEEDVETEDAWEIASRRASVISRRPSNHSIRIPPTSDAAPVSPASGPSGQPSTGVAFGHGTTSVDDLLVPESGSGRTSEDTGNSTPQAARSTEGVPISSRTAHSETVEPLATSVAQLSEDVDPLVTTRPTVAADPVPPLISPLTPSQPISVALPILGGWSPSGGNPASGTAFEDTQTPMNETFLSTLAGTGMHQRLDQVAEASGPRIEEDVEAEVEGDGTSSGSEPMAFETRQSGRGETKTETEIDGDHRMREASAVVVPEAEAGDIDMMFT